MTIVTENILNVCFLSLHMVQDDDYGWSRDKKSVNPKVCLQISFKNINLTSYGL
jgi:hypothetical protein